MLFTAPSSTPVIGREIIHPDYLPASGLSYGNYVGLPGGDHTGLNAIRQHLFVTSGRDQFSFDRVTQFPLNFFGGDYLVQRVSEPSQRLAGIGRGVDTGRQPVAHRGRRQQDRGLF